MTNAQIDAVLDRMEATLSEDDFDRLVDRNIDLPFHKWVQGIQVDGHPFSFVGREYLEVPYRDNHIWQVKQKATQVGGTVEEMLRAVYGLIKRGFRNILYYFPAANNVTDFSQARVGPLIDENPETIASHVKETNRANLRRFSGGFLHLLGMRSTMSVKSIPASMLIFDEFDEAPQLNFDKAMERIGGVLESEGDPPEVRLISNPSLPDYGVSRLFEETDQRYWLLICPSCGHENCMEDAFLEWVNGKSPPPLLEVGDRVIRACTKCQTELNPAKGVWRAKRPSITEKRGYHYTQLWSQTIMHSPEKVLAKYHLALKTGNLQDFFNLVIGIGYVEAENRLTMEEVLDLCGMKGIPDSDPGPCYMGVDVRGSGDLHVVIGKRLADSTFAEVIYLGIKKEFEEIYDLFDQFHCIRGILDGKPEGHSARKFVRKYPGKVFMYFDNVNQKGSYKWDKKEYKVDANRTEGLDSSHNAIRKQQVIFPKNCEITRMFAKHCNAIARKLEEIEEVDPKTGMKRKTGQSRYVWVKLTGDDHFRFAFNLFWMAFGLGLDGIFSDLEIG